MTRLKYPSDEELYTPRTLDYDFIVEEFRAEFKLDVKRLKEIWSEYKIRPSVALAREWYHLYPEFDEVYGCEIDEVDFSLIEKNPTGLKRVYYLQSPKDKNTKPIYHYSLEEMMLSDLQEERNKNKKLMAEARKAGDMDGFKRFNAMQNALKVIMNSTYGASANDKFAHYDPDVAAAITWASRQCILQLTEGLEGTVNYVDKEFLEDDYVKKNMKGFEEVKMLKIERVSDFSTVNRRQSLRRVFTDTYDVDTTKEIYKITKSPCELVYQDTDSNYFECHAVQKHFLGCAPWSPDPAMNDESEFRCSPEILYNAMLAMVALDNFLCSLVVKIIDRVPIGLGFEGSFLVCRYLNRKKKYYGIKAADDDGNVFDYRLAPEAYDLANKLISDFTKFWKVKESCVPLPNGQYIDATPENIKKILDRVVGILDFVLSRGVKVTGVDLNRRDQYGYINLAHLLILVMDLRICYYENQEWKPISLKEPISHVVERVIEMFRRSYNAIIEIANLRSDIKPELAYTIRDFAKSAKYSGKDNAAMASVKRYKAQLKTLYETYVSKYNIEDAYIDDGLLKMRVLSREARELLTENERERLKRIEGYIPYTGERLFYVITENDETRSATARGVKSLCTLTNLRRSIDELRDEIDTEDNKSYFNTHVGSLNITYEEWLNAKMISSLYLKHYVTALSSALALYQIGEKYPKEAAELDSDIYTDKEKAKIVDKLQDKIAQIYVDKYFPRNKYRKTNYSSIEKQAQPAVKTMKNETMKRKEIESVMSQLCPKVRFTEQVLPTIRLKNRGWAEAYHKYIDACDELVDELRNRFGELKLKPGSIHEKIYKQALNISDDLIDAIDSLREHYSSKYALTMKLARLLDDKA